MILPRPMRFPPASTRYAKPAMEPKNPTPTGAVIPVETIEYDEEGRRILTAPLAPPERPVPTIMPPPSVRLPPPTRTPSGAGLFYPGMPRRVVKFPPATVKPSTAAHAAKAQEPAPRAFRKTVNTICPDDIPF
ncbi:hypothetical protein IVB38_34565 [Bradyrhizobium sp. 38]|uniref:hypothetical protein n=1 Tax=unclassified Bradyrhizobium TaxID=2631580 RepID=UPI001FFA47B6|nr:MULTISPECIES: hypothetical protein [unclassified Bradyrhizobium]MCK1341004.1 hypothetical protein [Bradyrhizobium sp. 38]MCK1780987.1 hypothetical protein [Bradyrhizobium sp. 132]